MFSITKHCEYWASQNRSCHLLCRYYCSYVLCLFLCKLVNLLPVFLCAGEKMHLQPLGIFILFTFPKKVFTWARNFVSPFKWLVFLIKTLIFNTFWNNARQGWSRVQGLLLSPRHETLLGPRNPRPHDPGYAGRCPPCLPCSRTLQPPLQQPPLQQHLQLQHWQNETTHTLFASSSSKLAPLSTIVLKVKLLDIGDPRSILSTALSPPNLSGIVNTVLQLKEVFLFPSFYFFSPAVLKQSVYTCVIQEGFKQEEKIEDTAKYCSSHHSMGTLKNWDFAIKSRCLRF